jgi:hypothetical protein
LCFKFFHRWKQSRRRQTVLCELRARVQLSSMVRAQASDSPSLQLNFDSSNNVDVSATYLCFVCVTRDEIGLEEILLVLEEIPTTPKRQDSGDSPRISRETPSPAFKWSCNRSTRWANSENSWRKSVKCPYRCRCL